MELTTLLDIYLWLAPADSWTTVPVMIAGVSVGMLLLIIVFPRLSIKTFSSEESFLIAATEEDLKPRKDIRLQTKATIHAELSDGEFSSFGVVANISKEGMCIRGVSKSLTVSRSQLLVHVSDAHKQFWVLATPRWSVEDFGDTQVVGLAISPLTAEWPQRVTTN